MENKKNKKPLIALLVVFLVVILAGLCYLIFVLYNNYTSQNTNNNIQETYASNIEKETTVSRDEDNPDNPVDFLSLQSINQDIYAWIYIPNTNVDYPVFQSNTTDYLYIDHDINKEYKFAGSIYSEAANAKDFSDRNTVLYGHNMADKTMFATLHKFEDESFFNENKYIYIYQPQRKLTYEVVSAYNYDDRHLLNSFNFSDDEIYKSYLETVQNPRSTVKNVRDNVELNLSSKLITLSTCLDSDDSGRYIVQGVLIDDQRTK